MRFFILAIAIALAGCAGGNVKHISGPTIAIKETLKFSAVAGHTPGIKRYYHALRPGLYNAAYEDATGTFYIGEGESLILGAREHDDGSTEEPLAEGGFWLGKDQNTMPSLELFWLAGDSGRSNVLINDVAVDYASGQGRALAGPGRNLSPMQVGLAAGLGGAIAGGLLATQSFRMARYGPRRVPIRDLPVEKNALLNAMSGN